jgi:hypothetical protein
MNTRTVRPALHRNARAKPASACGWIGKRRGKPERFGAIEKIGDRDTRSTAAPETAPK